MKDVIRAYVLANAVRYKGRATPGSVTGKLLADHPELKAEMQQVAQLLRACIDDVNALSIDEQKKELHMCAPELLDTKRAPQRRVLPELKNVKDKVAMRFAPSPSGPLHIGHALGISLNSEYVKKYGGQFMMRIEDTNPSNIYPPAYDLIPKEAQWVTQENVSQVMIQSDRLELYYSYADTLLRKGTLYVCTCDVEHFRELVKQKSACPCRSLGVEDQLSRWTQLFTSFKQGEAVVRVKTDIEHKNPALRDFPVFRINEEEHPRTGTKYRVWPLMNFSVFVDDCEAGMTHIIRAKEHADNAKRQEYLYRALDKPIPETRFIGRINFTDMRVSCSKTRPLVEDGTYSGWDDIRLPFLGALRRRGFQPEAFIKYAIHIGVSLNDKTVSKNEYFKLLNAYNKEVIDDSANRYFAVLDPVSVHVDGAPSRTVELDFHPDHRKGGRTLTVGPDVMIARTDYEKLVEGKVHRFMDAYNVEKKGEAFHFVSQPIEDFRGKGGQLIHWVSGESVPVKVCFEDGTVREGVGEVTLKNLHVGDVVQLVRIGFCRLDAIDDGTYVFWFAHT